MKIVSVICYLLLAGGTAVLTEEVWCSCWGWEKKVEDDVVEGGWEGVEGGRIFMFWDKFFKI